MSTKDLFKKGNKALTKSQEEKIRKDLESPELAADVVKSNNKFHSHIDFSKPENFSFYGSAQKYYEDSFNRIYQTYPYDGSLSEKEKWFYDSSELDLWILDNVYPKSTGYVRLGTNQSIFVKGGPNKEPSVIEGEKEELSKQFPVKQGNSNIWDPSIQRTSNLHLDLSLGFTVELWMKFDNPEEPNFIPFVIGNSGTTGRDGDGSTGTPRLSIESLGSGAGVLTISLYDDDYSGGTLFSATGLNNFFESTWNHYSFSFINSGDKVKTEIYKNGILVADYLNGTSLGEISQEELYLNINGTMSSISATRSKTTDGMYVDEFRFWKRRRTAEEIGRYWHTHIDGGTNTDDNKYSLENRKVDIGVYYKFNEGITGYDDIDSTVLDYSGRISNGEIINYDSSVRSTGSAFNESGFFEVSEEKDPIIYSSHPAFASTKEAYMQEGLTYDYTNNSSIYHTMPAWIIEEDEEKGQNVKELSQVISSYFDSAQVKIKELINLKDVGYHTLEERTNKPYSLIRRTLGSAGMVVPDLFTEASVFEEVLSRGEQEKFEEKLQDVKNTIYQNIYNNLSYIYKSKGTEKAFRNLIRCFGIDDELIKINLYSDGADYVLEDTRRTTAIKKKFIDFNDSKRDQGLIYTKEDPNNPKSSSCIKGVPDNLNVNLSFTFQTEVIFPKKVQSDHPSSQPQTNQEENIAFVGNYLGDYTEEKIFSVIARKESYDANSDNVKFVLNFAGHTLETEFFSSVYENSKWNIAVRLVPKKTISTIVEGTTMPDYQAELYCVRMLADSVEEESFLVVDIDKNLAKSILEKDKFVSIGAKSTTGNPEHAPLNNSTRLKISSTLFWYDNVTNEEIKAHASDASNFGRLRPSEEAYLTDAQINPSSISIDAIQVPRRDTLAMHWDFSEVTTTDNAGEFIVDDLSADVTATTEIINQNAIRYPNMGDAIDLGDISDFTFNDGNGTDKPFSFSTWVFSTDYASEDGVFVSKRHNALGSEYFFGNSNGEIQAILYADPAQNNQGSFNTMNRLFVSSGNVLQDNTWHNVTITYDGTQNLSGLKLFLDGEGLTPTSTDKNLYNGMGDSTSKTYLGGTQSPSTNNFEGLMADTVFYNKALTGNEVLEIYNGGRIKDIAEFSDYDSVISWYKMGDDLDEQGSDGILDYVSNNHGTLINGASIKTSVGLETDRSIKGRYGWFTELVGYEVTGRGKHFDPNDTQIVNREFVYSAKHRPPEVINSEDLIEIRQQDDVTFTKEAQVVSHFFAAEKSMYQVISDDMINLFATIVEFNNLIGQPVNRYRIQYKSLEKFRARYFEKVKNVPSLEKYIELYKWIDSSIGLMLQELIPVSSNFSADLRNMVESHVLERNKYWTKFPTMEMAGEPPLGIVKGINELTYNWEHGHAPNGTDTIENDRFLWGDKRVEATNTSISTGDADVDKNREILRRVATRKTEGNTKVVERDTATGKKHIEEDKPFLRESPVSEGVPGAVYSGQAYVTRALSRPYKLNLDFSPTIHGGANYSPTTKDPNAFIRGATRIIPGSGTVGLDVDLVDNTPTYEQWKELYTVKRSTTIIIADTDINFTEYYDGDVIYPYYGEDLRDPYAFITGHHNDSYGDDAEIPAQGPFTETWVGGNQHRHIEPMYKSVDGKVGFNFGKIVVPNNSDLSFTDDTNDYSFAISLWVKPNEASTSYLFSKNDSSALQPREYQALIRNDGRLQINMFSADSQMIFQSDAGLIYPWSNEWFHIVFNYDASPTSVPNSSALSFHINGQLINTSVDSSPYDHMQSGSRDFIIGSPGHGFVDDANFTGLMRDFVVFNFKNQEAPLSISEVAELYNNNIENHSKYSDIVAWWKLENDLKSSVNSPAMDGTGTNVSFSARPELYLEDDDGLLKHPHEINPYHETARYTREEVAKRPINIKNIKTGESILLGNYARDYEVVQTSSRTKNNRWFVKNEGNISEYYLESPYISGSVDFELPDRTTDSRGEVFGKSKHVIVERFSAPGDPLTLSRGHLDRIAEEFSVYNSMNYRNFDEREQHRINLTAHSDFYEGSQGYVESTNALANIHKINRNTSHVPTGKNYDNAFISHQIPRSDFQYNVEMLSENRQFYDFGEAGERSYAEFNQGSILVSDNDDLSFNDDAGNDYSFAISLWVNVGDYHMTGGAAVARLFGKQTSTENAEYTAFFLQRGDIQFTLKDGTSGHTFNTSTSTNFFLDNWNHIVFNYDTSTSTMSFWINGVLAGTEQESSPNYTSMDNMNTDFIIGETSTNGSGTGSAFTGKMRDFVIFNFKQNNVPALSESEVLELYNDNIVNHTRFSDIVAWWKMNGDTKSTVNSPAMDGTATNISFAGESSYTLSDDYSSFSSSFVGEDGLNRFLQLPAEVQTASTSSVSNIALGASVHDGSVAQNGIVVPHSTDFDMVDSTGANLPFTFAFWIKHDNPSGSERIFAKKTPTSGANDALEYEFMFLGGTGNPIRFLIYGKDVNGNHDGGFFYVDNNAFPKDEWVHMAFTYDATPTPIPNSSFTSPGTVKFYRNGVLSVTTVGQRVHQNIHHQMGPLTRQNPLLIGFGNTLISSVLGGGSTGTTDDKAKLSNFIVFKNAALTDTQILEIKNAGVNEYSTLSTISSAVAHFPLASDAKSTIGDHEGEVTGVEFTTTDTPSISSSPAPVQESSPNESSIEDPPDGAGFGFRSFEYNNPIISKASVSFNVYEHPSNTSDEHFYFQYKLGDAAWTTLKIFEQGTGYRIDNYTCQETIDLGQSIDNPIYLRWVGRVAESNGNGIWGIDNVSVSQTSFQKYPKHADITKGDGSYADYQGAGFRFVKNVENRQVINQRKNNIYSQLDRTLSNGSQDRSSSFFTEPAISWNKPNTHFILNERYDGYVRSGSESPRENESIEGLNARKKNIRDNSNPITYSYSNNLEMFANEGLTKAINKRFVQKNQFAYSLVALLKKADLLFSRTISREIIFPKHKNVGLRKTRNRSYYDSYKIFWRDNMLDRIKCLNNTKLGYEITQEQLSLYGQVYSLDVMDNFFYKQKPAQAGAIFSGTSSINIPNIGRTFGFGTPYGANFDEYSFAMSLWIKLTNFEGEQQILLSKSGRGTGDEFGSTGLDYSLILRSDGSLRFFQGPSYFNQDVNSYDSSANVIDFDSDEEFNIVIFYDAGAVTSTDALGKMFFYVDGSLVSTSEKKKASGRFQRTSFPFMIGNEDVNIFDTIQNPGSEGFQGIMRDVVVFKFSNNSESFNLSDVNELYSENIRNHPKSESIVAWWTLSDTANVTIGDSRLNGIAVNVPFSVTYSVVGDLTYMGKDRITSTITRTDVPSLVNSRVLSAHHLEEKCSIEADTSYKSLYPYEVQQASESIPSPQLYHNPYSEAYMESQGWINKKVLATGITPADDTYDSFSEDIRLAAQGYGLVSEFRISEHMDKYLIENGGDFRAKNYDFLTLDGANYYGNNQNVHTQTSKKVVEDSVATFYSVKKELESNKVEAYPTSSTDNTLIKNNSSDFFESNPVYSPAASTFDISNSLNTSFEINQTITTNYSSDLPNQDGINASGLFNIEENKNDFIVVEMNNVSGEGEVASLRTQMNISPKDYNESPSTSGYPNGFTVSLWAKLDENRDLAKDYGLWSAGDSSGISMNLYANKYQAVGGGEGGSKRNFGLSFAINDPMSGLVSQIVFFRDIQPVTLNEGEMNHIAFQLIPPEPSKALSSLYKRNYLIKLWLNGEELYGAPYQAYVTYKFAFSSGGSTRYQPAYSPCPIGRVERPVSQEDWSNSQPISFFMPPTEQGIGYETNSSTIPVIGCENLNGISRIESFVIGNCDYQTSLAGGDPDDKFVGTIDEFVVLNGILPSSSIKSLYNDGKPSNINELAINKQIVGNLLVESSGLDGVGDNGEFDIGYQYYSNFTDSSETDKWEISTDTIDIVIPSSGYPDYPNILALKGTWVPRDSVENPPDEFFNDARIGDAKKIQYCRYVELKQSFNSSINIEFRVHSGTGSEDPYALANVDGAERVLFLQCEFDDSGTWDTLKTITGTQFIDNFKTDLSETWSASVDNPTGKSVKIRFIQVSSTNTADREEFGISNLAISRKNRINLLKNVSSSPEQRENSYIEIPYISFSEENYSVVRQKETTLTIPVWHRIGVPLYTVSESYDTWDEEFFDSYVHTDNLNFIQKAERSHSSLGLDTENVFRLKVNAVKKLLPYDGFYPQDRTVQIADLFVQKIQPDLIYAENTSKQQAIQAAMQHFFAPGILYNSIKAGIACDWATYTNNSGLEPNHYGEKFNVIDASGSFTQRYLQDPHPFWFSQPAFLDERSTPENSPENSKRLSTTPPDEKMFFGLKELPLALSFYENFGLLVASGDISQTDSDINVSFSAEQLLITKEPNKRLPFESLLDPISFLQDGTDEQSYALSGTNVSVVRKPNQHFLVNPTYYTNHLDYVIEIAGENNFDFRMEGNYKKYNFPYFEIKKTQENKSDARYQMAMHNFLSETVKFFVKNEKLSSFASQPESQFKVMNEGVTYYMDVALSKSDGFSPVYSPGSLGGRYFGPPAQYTYARRYFNEAGEEVEAPIADDDYIPFAMPKDWIKDPAYAMYTPPYFYGESVVRISFTPNDGDRVYSLEEIFTKATTESISDEIDALFYKSALETTADVISTFNKSPQPAYDGDFRKTTAYKARMPLSSSIELFGKTSLMRQEFDSQGNPRTIASANGTELDTWVIYSKFECPLFDFSKESLKKSDLNFIGASTQPSENEEYKLFNYEASHLNPNYNSNFLQDPMVGTGIWASYANQNQSGGVTVSIRESFPKGISPDVGSLVKVCGFAPAQQDIGRVADSKEFSEAVVMIPFLDGPLTVIVPGIDQNREAYNTVKIDDRHFIKIDGSEYASQKEKINNGDRVFYVDDRGNAVFETSISRVIKCMQKYNMPPRFDFETYNTAPFAMYFFEFNHTFDKEDLTNIWQGLKPKLADKAVLDSVEITHKINSHEIFGNLDEVPKGVRWMVFKVKKKAEKNYYRLTSDSRDDSRFKFKFDVGLKEPEYGYNYPYDYFTMLELIQVEADSEQIVDPLEQFQKLRGGGE